MLKTLVAITISVFYMVSCGKSVSLIDKTELITLPTSNNIREIAKQKKEKKTEEVVKKPALYDEYTEEELELLFRVVEAEVTGGDVESKSHVASVIFNRLKDGWWGGDLTKNLMAKRQFAVVTNGRYLKVTITESTIEACELAFEQNTAQGALFFDSTDGNSWAHENREFVFRDHVGHNFYR